MANRKVEGKVRAGLTDRVGGSKLKGRSQSYLLAGSRALALRRSEGGAKSSGVGNRTSAPPTGFWGWS